MSTYLTTLATEVPQFEATINEMKDLFSKKLWHQLTDLIQTFLSKQEVRATVPLVKFYDSVIADFASRANQLRLASMAVTISREIQDVNEKLQFLLKVLSAKYIQDDKEAAIFLSSNVAIVEVEAGKVEEATERLEKEGEKLELLTTADAQVHAAYFKARASVAHSKSDAAAFHRAALQHLAYEAFEDMPANERIALAVNLSLASLRAPQVYQFGELLHERGVGAALSGSSHDWLARVLEALNQGDLTAWKALEQKHAAELKANDLSSPQILALLRQKASILAVIELVFQRPASERIISFNDIAGATDTPINKVEMLLMRALALGLIKGRIDEPQQLFNVSWVQPRVLGAEHLQTMSERLDKWGASVKDALNLIEGQISPEMLA